MKQYQYKKGARITTPVDMAVNELERIREAGNGYLTPQAVVDESKPKKAVLHHEFEWNDAIAANEHRKSRARDITRSILVIEENRPITRLFETMTVQETPQEEGKAVTVYATRDEVMSYRPARDQLLAQAFRDLAAVRRRYGDIQELAKIFVVLDEVLVELDVS